MNDAEKSRLPMLRRRLVTTSITQNEVLEFLLLSVCKIENAKEKVDKIVERYRDINIFLNLDCREISAFLEVDFESANFLHYFPRLIKHYSFISECSATRLRSIDELIEYLIDNVKNSNYEQFFVVFLNPQGSVLNSKRIKSLSATKLTVSIDELVCEARSLCAAAVAISHSHPQGTINPTLRDDSFTKVLHVSLTLANILFVDHIITNSVDYYSYRKSGVLEKYEKIALTEYGVRIENVMSDYNNEVE